MYDVWCTLMYINVHHSWWCKMMYIIFYIMMYGGATSWYIMMYDAHHIWCEVMHIIIKYDSKWCASSHIISDVHHKYIWCIMMCNDLTSFFFSNFFLEILNSCIFLFQRLFAKGRMHHNPSFYHLYNTSFFPHLSSCDFHAQLIMWQFSFICTLVTCEQH